MPKSCGLGEDAVGAVDAHGLDGRDVERELEGVADADRAALEVVGVARRVVAGEVVPTSISIEPAVSFLSSIATA